MILIKPISPVAIDILGFKIRWYAIAYILAFVVGLWMFKRLVKAPKKYYDDLLTYVIIGVIIGGRIGYVLFYNAAFFMEYPLEIFMLWHGGMSFHGGLIGVVVATFIFAKINSKNAELKADGLCGGGVFKDAVGILDRLAVVAPVGLFFGRIANFINMELMGRATDSPLGVVFEGVTTVPQHPSPLYEAAAEGVLLLIIMRLLWRVGLGARTGFLTGAGACCYGVLRIFCEQFRAPDVQIGYLAGTDWLTMGMVLSFAMIAAGLALIFTSFRAKRAAL